MQQKIRDRLKQLDEERRRSVTFDNGSEFARCHRLEKHLGIDLYFADPGCPHQRGTNENTNGLIRQFFPKGIEFRDITHHVRDESSQAQTIRFPLDNSIDKDGIERLVAALQTREKAVSH